LREDGKHSGVLFKVDTENWFVDSIGRKSCNIDDLAVAVSNLEANRSWLHSLGGNLTVGGLNDCGEVSQLSGDKACSGNGCLNVGIRSECVDRKGDLVSCWAGGTSRKGEKDLNCFVSKEGASLTQSSGAIYVVFNCDSSTESIASGRRSSLKESEGSLLLAIDGVAAASGKSRESKRTSFKSVVGVDLSSCCTDCRILEDEWSLN